MSGVRTEATETARWEAHADLFHPNDLSLLARERDLVVRNLRARADAIAAMSPIEFLAREGVDVARCVQFEIAGRLAKEDVLSIEWSANDGAWRVYARGASGNYESTVRPERIAEILRGRE